MSAACRLPRLAALPLLLLLTATVLSGCGNDFAPAPAEERTAEVGLLLRRNYTDDPGQERAIRHLDVLLPDGRIAGFHPLNDDELGALRKLFLPNPGQVRDYELIRHYTPQYVDAAVAADCTWGKRNHQMLTTYWVHLKVTPQQAQAFTAAWDEMAVRPPVFRLWGSNCSTRGYDALQQAGIVPSGLPGFDTPAAVFRRVLQFYPDARIEDGFFGYDRQMRPYLAPLPQQQLNKQQEGEER